MEQVIRYPASNFVIPANETTPIPIAETEILNTLNMDEYVANAIRSNSQGAFNFVVNLGSLTSVKFRIYYYSKHEIAKDNSGDYISYAQTTSAFSGGSETLLVDEIVVNDSSLNNVGLSYMFPIRPCDAIRITVQGVGTNTGSSLKNAFVSLRIN